MRLPLMLGKKSGGSSSTSAWDRYITSLDPLAWWKLADAGTAAPSSGTPQTIVYDCEASYTWVAPPGVTLVTVNGTNVTVVPGTSYAIVISGTVKFNGTTYSGTTLSLTYTYNPNIVSGASLGDWESVLSGMSSTAMTASCAQMKAAGMTYVRFDCDYVTGTVTNSLDNAISAVKTAGMIPIIILEDTEEWNDGIGQGNFGSAWATFCGNAATHYKALLGAGQVYELSNEVNQSYAWISGTINCATYVAGAKLAYAAIKAVDPSAIVLMSGLAAGAAYTGSHANTTSNMSALDFITGCYDALGGAGPWDALNVHPYQYSNFGDGNTNGGLPLEVNLAYSIFYNMPAIYAIMEANGDGAKKIWGTEYGLPIGTDNAQGVILTANMQGLELAMAFQFWATLSYAGPFLVFNWFDSSDGAYGLYSSPSPYTVGTARAALAIFEANIGAPTIVPTLVLGVLSNLNATIGVAFSDTLTATGGTGAFSYTAGGLPAGLTLAPSTGVISGTPTTAATSTVNVTVTDAVGDIASGSFQIVVAAASTAPVGPSGTWALVWHDEFDDSAGSSGPTNGLSKSKWNIGWYQGPATLGAGGNQTSTTPPANPDDNGNYHSPSTVTLPGDGSLHLQGVAGSFDGYTYNCGGIGSYGLWSLNPRSIPLGTTIQNAVNAGEITVINGELVIEARIRWPGPSYNSAGTLITGANSWWPVWWSGPAGNFGSSSGWGSHFPGGSNYITEIDMWEDYEGFTDGKGCLGSEFRLSLPATGTEGDGSSYVSNPSSLANVDMSLAFHTHTMQVTAAGVVTFWVDGIEVVTPNMTDSAMEGEWLYPQWMSFMMQSHKGTNPPNTTAAGNNDMMIDYVRIWTPTAAVEFDEDESGGEPLMASGPIEAIDSSGNGHTGTVSGGVTFETWSPLASAPSEKGASFDGSTGSISTTYNPSGLSAMSVMFIMNSQGNNQTGYNRILASDYTKSTNAGFDICVYGTTALQAQASIGNGTTFGEIVLTNGTVPGTGAQIVVVTWDGTTIKCYLNGVLDSVTASLSGTLAAASVPLSIGINPADGYGYFNGELAQIAVFGTALSQTQVSAIQSASNSNATTAATITLGGRYDYGNAGNDENTFIEQIGGNPSDSVLMEYLNTSATWGVWDTSGVWDAVGGFAPGFTIWPGGKMIKVPMQVTGTPLLWTDVTGGGQDANFTAFFQWCLANGVQFICPGWEFNGNWYPWGIEGNDTTANQQGFVATWIHIWNLANAVAPGYFKFWWNPSAMQYPGIADVTPGGAYYPGDQFVDGIGMDIYNNYNASTTWPGDAVYLQTLESGPQPNWDTILTYCQAHGKAIIVPEWGLNGGGASNGGDDPTFVTNVFDLGVAAANLGVPVFLFPWVNTGANPFTQYPNSLAELTTLVGQAVANGMIVGGTAAPTLSITQVGTQTATVGTAFSITFVPVGGTSTYSWSNSGLPAGLTQSGTTISGTPTATFASTVTITCKDSSSPQQTATMSFVFDVVASSNTLVPNCPGSLDAPTTLVWHDEFTAGSLNTEYWGVVSGPTDNGIAMSSAMVSFGPNGIQLENNGSNGSLVTTGTWLGGQSGAGFTCNPTGGGTLGSSGPIYVEFSAYIPEASNGEVAYWPALWLVGQNWPQDGEIDVFEGLGGANAIDVHYGTGNSDVRINLSGSAAQGGNHVYGLLWTASGQTFVVDGVVVGTASVTAAQMLNAPQAILLENGGTTSNGPAPATTPAVMTVRYVRVWQG
jgi:hypothetical protein